MCLIHLILSSGDRLELDVNSFPSRRNLCLDGRGKREFNSSKLDLIFLCLLALPEEYDVFCSIFLRPYWSGSCWIDSTMSRYLVLLYKDRHSSLISTPPCDKRYFFLPYCLVLLGRFHSFCYGRWKLSSSA